MSALGHSNSAFQIKLWSRAEAGSGPNLPASAGDDSPTKALKMTATGKGIALNILAPILKTATA
jgi:hypothetical protein